MLAVALDMKRDYEAEEKRFSENTSGNTAHWRFWRARSAVEFLADLIDELQIEREPGRGCWACRIQDDIMNNITWCDRNWVREKGNVWTQEKAAERLNMRDDCREHRTDDRFHPRWVGDTLFRRRWNSVWNAKFMLSQMWKVTLMPWSDIDQRVQEKHEASRRLEQ